MKKLNDNLTVLKYGGSSVATLEKIKEIAKYLKYRLKNNNKLIIVVSAMGDTTNTLLKNIKINMAIDRCLNRSKNQILSI